MPSNDPRRAELERLLLLPPGASLDVLLAYHPAFFELPGLLRPRETVRAYCVSKLEQSGQDRAGGGWVVVCTEERLIFLSKTLLRFSHFEIERRDITAIEEDPGWIFFSVKIVAGGSTLKLFQYGKPDMVRLLAALRGP